MEHTQNNKGDKRAGHKIGREITTGAVPACPGMSTLAKRTTPAHGALIEELQAEFFAEDLFPPPESINWSDDLLHAWFADGGALTGAAAEHSLSTLMEGTIPATAFTPAELTASAVQSMHNPATAQAVCQALLQCILDLPAEDALAQRALQLLLQLGCSNSGISVQIHYGTTGLVSDVAVLILGFAGANMGMLSLVADTYRRLHPEWRVVSTTRPGVTDPAAEPAKQQQLDEVAASLQPCSKLLLHVMSNNGQLMWSRLLQRCPSLGERVAGIVFDCVGPKTDGTDYPAVCQHQVVKQTMLACAFIHELPWTPPPGGPQRDLGEWLEPAVQVAMATQAARAETMRAFDEGGLDDPACFEADHDPPVPALLLAGTDDQIVPLAATEAFADLLRRRQPSRRVSVETIRGQHVRLLGTSPKEFTRHLEALIADAGLDGT